MSVLLAVVELAAIVIVVNIILVNTKHMKRKVYYVTYADSEDYENGICHFSEPLLTLEDAKKREELMDWSNMNTRIESHNEIFQNDEWQPDFDMTNWLEVIED
jgi:hypothetical protein